MILLAAVTPSSAQTSLTSVTGGGESTASDTVVLPEHLTPENIRQLVSTLSDEQVRELLLQRLDAVAQSENQTAVPDGGTVLDFLEETVAGIGTSVSEAVVRVPRIYDGLETGMVNFEKPAWIFRHRLFDHDHPSLPLAAGWLLKSLSRAWPANARRQIQETEAPDGLKQTLELLGKRLLLDMAGLLAFFAVTRVLIGMLVPDIDRQVVEVFMVNMVVLPRLVAAVGRFLLAPFNPALRLVHTDDWTARFLYYNQIGIVVLMGSVRRYRAIPAHERCADG